MLALLYLDADMIFLFTYHLCYETGDDTRDMSDKGLPRGGQRRPEAARGGQRRIEYLERRPSQE
jgi:hypothetical protein